MDRTLDRILTWRLVRALDPVLGVRQARSMHSLLLLIPMAITFVLGARTSQFGHIDTVGSIFPLMTVISVLNPFAGLLAALAFGVGDLAQKFVVDDVFYESARTGADYWSARGGYVLAYSSLVVFGLLPGMLSRLGALGGRRVATLAAARKADGAAASSSAETIGAVVGGAVGGVLGGAIAATAFKGLVAPAFLWRISPDHSCYQLSMANVGASTPAVVGTGAVGGGGVTLAPRPTATSPAQTRPPRDRAKDHEDPSDPCAERRGRVDAARTISRASHVGLQELRRIRNLLEMEWELTREASYLSGVIDVGFLLGSVWTKPVEGWKRFAGRAIAEKVIGNQLLAASVKALGKEVTKDITKSMLEQNIAWEDLVLKPGVGVSVAGGVAVPEGWFKKLIQQKIEESVTRDTMSNLMGQGLRASGPAAAAYEQTRNKLVEQLAKPMADWVGNWLSLATMGAGAISGRKKLAAIREQMSQIDAQIFEVEQIFEDAVHELDLARSALEHCLQLQREVVEA